MSCSNIETIKNVANPLKNILVNLQLNKFDNSNNKGGIICNTHIIHQGQYVFVNPNGNSHLTTNNIPIITKVK